MVGQELDVVALYDSDAEGNSAMERLVKRWLTRYSNNKAAAFSLGPMVGEDTEQFAIEDLFPEKFYTRFVMAVYEKKLKAVEVGLEIPKGSGQLCKRFEAFFNHHGLEFNKGSVAKRLCRAVREMGGVSELPEGTAEKVRKLFETVRSAFPER